MESHGSVQPQTPEARPATEPGDGSASPLSADPLPKLSDDLTLLVERMEAGNLTVGELEAVLKGRGILMLVVVFAAPFALIPVLPPGLSVIAALVIGFIGLRLSLGMDPWLPDRLRAREVSGGFVQKLLTKLVPIFKKLERWLAPRWVWLFWPGARHFFGVSLILAAALLSLPWPMPNMIPAWIILVLAVGYLNRDGLLVLVGYGLLVGTTLVVVVFFSVFVEASRRALEYMGLLQ